jgi:ribosome biogenesis GTPase A
MFCIRWSVAVFNMAIQWFPGHMHLTRKAIGERIKDIDVVIEMLDARLPGSSANPMLADLIEGKPALKILSKQDLEIGRAHV